MHLRGKTILADCAWLGRRMQENIAIQIADDGTIAYAGDPQQLEPSPAHAIRFPRLAFLPGFVNAHSHAFQRGLRATPQRFETGSGNFWSWRETMYRLVDSLDADGFYDQSRRAFSEMLAAGFTSVGEFHYFHHVHGASAEQNYALDDAIISAAADAGLRLVLLQTYYATGNVNQPLAGAQNCFSPLSREQFVKQLDHLAGKLDSETQSLALACHSIRAVPPDDLKYFRDAAKRNGWPMHIHVEEVRKEIDDCRAAYGAGPMRTLLQHDLIDENLTAIHCTHSTPADLREFIKRGGRICLCPITEGNLSDGFPNLPFMRSAGGRICIGTDSNIRISPADELRTLEFGQRARHESRGVVVDKSGACAAALFEIGTIGGAESLGLRVGEIAAGRPADLIAIDLDHPIMHGTQDGTILDTFLFGSGNEAIAETWVGGRNFNDTKARRT